MSVQDYSDHLDSLKKYFLATPGIKLYKVDERSSQYLDQLVAEVIFNNEIFFKTLKVAHVIVIDAESPLHFSLPGGDIFLSKGLISRYIKNESLLVSILAYELVRMEKVLYPKQIVIPVGYVSMERMMVLNRLNLDEKMEVHKWAHHLTIRSGYDGEYYLSWLQTQNRNTADFLFQAGDANLITREESLFKSFLIKNTDEDAKPFKKESSKSFYTFINRFRDGAI